MSVIAETLFRIWRVTFWILWSQHIVWVIFTYTIPVFYSYLVWHKIASLRSFVQPSCTIYPPLAKHKQLDSILSIILALLLTKTFLHVCIPDLPPTVRTILDSKKNKQDYLSASPNGRMFTDTIISDLQQENALWVPYNHVSI